MCLYWRIVASLIVCCCCSINGALLLLVWRYSAHTTTTKAHTLFINVAHILHVFLFINVVSS